MAAVQEPIVVQRLKDLGTSPHAARGPEEVTKELQADINLYRKVVTEARIELD